jgi:tRNA threonylcarbamoyladenosine biosynthesis protein TsaB
MKTLIIDTATEQGITALYEGDTLIKEIILPKGFESSTHLISYLSDALNELKLKISDFSLIVVGVGPGSYTGLRVGITVSQAFSFACEIPLVGVSSLKGLVREGMGPFISVIDARSLGLYTQRGIRTEEGVIFEGEIQSLSLEKIILREGEVFVTSDPFLVEKKLKGYPVENVLFSHEVLYKEGLSLYSKEERGLKINY